MNRNAFKVMELSKDGRTSIGVSWWCASKSCAYINGAAQQGASLQGFADYPVQVSGCFAELVHLRHAACEVLKTLSGAASRQSLIGAIQPDTTYKTHTYLLMPSAAAFVNVFVMRRFITS